MFHTERDSSKVALAHLLRYAAENGLELVDCQLSNEHLLSMGAREIPRSLFLERLAVGNVRPTPEPEAVGLTWPEGGFRMW